MFQSVELFSGMTLRCITTDRFKQAVLSIQFLRPMWEEEAAVNALIPEILLRGCESAPDLRQITARLDDLYGASVGTQVSRAGDIQAIGLTCGFVEDRFALPGDRVLEPMVEFLGQLLLHPLTEKGVFCQDFVRSEKQNLISALEARRNDKQAYAMDRLFKNMCKGDSYAVSRLGTVAQVRKITAASAYEQYRKLLTESPVEIFYVGSATAEEVGGMLRPVFENLQRNAGQMPPQKPLIPAKPSRRSEKMAVAQGKVAMGFVTPITYADPRYAAMQVCNCILGAGSTSKLFMNVREKKSLCYAIGSTYYGSKGIVTVHAGIDTGRFGQTRAEILQQLEDCRRGQITQEELNAAKEGLLSGLRAVYDSPGAMCRFFFSNALSGVEKTVEQHAAEIRAVELEDVIAAANSLRFHSSFFVKGADHE